MESKSRARISRLGILVLMGLLFTAAFIPLSARAVTQLKLTPDHGPVENPVGLTGEIDTNGGNFGVLFDGALVAWGSAASSSLEVSTSFTVPQATGSDAGQPHIVTLRDNATKNAANADFKVETSRSISVSPGRIQEGLDAAITVSVTGGIAGATYSYDVSVLEPNGDSHTVSVSLGIGAEGSGSGSISYPSDFSPSANMNFVGDYAVSARETIPGTTNPPADRSFSVALLDRLSSAVPSYKRFERFSIRSTGWVANEELRVDYGNFHLLNAHADSNGVLRFSTTLSAGFQLGISTASVANSTDGGFGGTVKDPADSQDFEVFPSTGITISVVDRPAASYQRTETATAKLRIEYPDGSPFTAPNAKPVFVDVVNQSHGLIQAVQAEFDGSLWVASWQIPKGADLQNDLFSVPPASVTDAFGNSGPLGTVDSASFAINKAVLSVAITRQWSDLLSLLQGKQVEMGFTVKYLDGSPFTDADLGSAAVSVSFGGQDITQIDASFAAGTWSAVWSIPNNAQRTVDFASTYRFAIRAGSVVDQFGNANVGDLLSNRFALLAFAPAMELGVLDVQIDVGSLHVPGEVAGFTILTASGGQPVTADSIQAKLRLPSGELVALDVEQFEIGLYSAQYALAGDAATGSYSIEVLASASPGGLVQRGVAVRSFLVSASLEGLHAQLVAITGDLVTIRTDLGSIQVGLAHLNAMVTDVSNGVVTIQTDVGTVKTGVGTLTNALQTLSPVITEVRNNIATIRTDVGDIKASLTALDGKVTSIQGNIATIQTNLGTMQADVTAINAKVTSIQNGQATIQTDLGTVKTDVAAIHGQVTDIQNGVATVKTDVGILKTDVASIRPQITDISNGVVTVKTDVGTLKTDVAAIKPVVTSIQGDVATVKTDVGTVKGTVTSMQGDVATVKTDVGTIKARVPSEVASAPTVQNAVVLLYIVAGLALVAAVGALGAVRVIIRRLAR